MNRAEPYPVTQTPNAPAVGAQPSTADRIETAIALSLQAAVILGFLVLPFLPTAENQYLPANPVLSLPSRIAAYLSGWAYVGSGVLVLALTRGRTSGRAFGIFSAAAGFGIATMGFTAGGGWFFITWGTSAAVAFGALVHLALVYPHDVTADNRAAIRWLVYLPGLLLVALSAFSVFGAAGGGSQRVLIGAYTFYGAAMTSFTLLWMGMLVSRSASPYEREQARLWLLALCGAIIVPFVTALLELWFANIHLDAVLGYIPLGIFPLVITYSILRFEKLGGPYLISRVVGYASLTVLILLSYALLVAGASILFSGLTPWSASVLVGVLALVLAFGLQPVKDILQSFIDEVFFRSQHLSNQRLQRFSQDLTRALGLPAIIELTRRYILSDLTPETLHVFIRDPMSDIFEAAPDQDGQATTEVRFPASSVIARQLAQQKRPMILGSQETLPTPVQAERARLALVGALLYIPLLGQQQLVGWLALGPRKSGEKYSTIDVRYMNAIGNQAALAVERAQVIANLQRQVRETDVLARVAQGINITVRFDDILELIYAQTNHIIPCKDFQITLKDERDPEKLYHAFFVAEDERLDTMENIPLPKGKGLAAEVIREGTAIRSDNYESKCRAKGVLPDRQGIEAWMGIPLNAGADVIGAICIGSREPGSMYTQRQGELLQAIADQAAGAIIKARLLEESERHARQLATLNEIGRSLTSTLDLSPLLTQILNSATEILNCEAGTLFSVEEESGEMVFEVTVGPVAENLLGRSLPAGTGIVGKAVQKREPIIANNVKETSFWFDQSDLDTGFETRDLLVVPMIFKERVTGVIEVINKKDGSPFTREDLELLATFTSQAAIATENARLYTQTDEALTARLEEMSVLQRVDRELNTSLDLERTMRISLDWAMRQSQAEAGMIGHLDEGEGGEHILSVMASRGYTQLPTSKEDSGGYSGSENRPRLALPEHISAAIRHGQAVQFDAADAFEDETAGKAGLLEGGRSALVVPIRRQGATIALILMESPRWSAFSEETLAFLSRLSDHAAIAITNARLYADLQAANIAKSEYVSLVSHELKTPMTSIRGYTDLLSQGVVGEINDAQANFLSTIRTNVGRMATLVSDLADVSRIEADRLRLEFSAVDIGQVIEEVSHSQKALIDEKNQELQVQLPVDMPAVWGDQSRLVQILTNLVGNANKYTPREGSIEISAEVSPNTWDPQGAPQVVHVRVKDNGYGISEEDRKKIFQKFFRSDAQNIRDAPGTGLGLNITRHLVEMQGGRIWFESKIGSGSVFQFTVPVAATG